MGAPGCGPAPPAGADVSADLRRSPSPGRSAPTRRAGRASGPRSLPARQPGSRRRGAARARRISVHVLFAPAWSYRSTGERRRLHAPSAGSSTGWASTTGSSSRTRAARSRTTPRPLPRPCARRAGAGAGDRGQRQQVQRGGGTGALTPGGADESAGVAGWLNVAGALRGSPLADAVLYPPASWIGRLVFWLADWSWAGVTSMTTSASRARLAAAQLPASIAVVNLVACRETCGRHGVRHRGLEGLLRLSGPARAWANDGVVLLADTVWPGGANLVVLGADHLFSSRQRDADDVALLRAVDFAVRATAAFSVVSSRRGRRRRCSGGRRLTWAGPIVLSYGAPRRRRRAGRARARPGRWAWRDSPGTRRPGRAAGPRRRRSGERHRADGHAAHRPLALAQPHHEVVAVDLRHADVGQHQVEGMGLERAQPLGGRGHHRDPGAGRLQHRRHQRARFGVVVDEQRCRPVSSPSPTSPAGARPGCRSAPRVRGNPP